MVCERIGRFNQLIHIAGSLCARGSVWLADLGAKVLYLLSPPPWHSSNPAWHHPNVSFKLLSWVLPNLQKPLKSDIKEHVQLAMVSQIVSKQEMLFNPHNQGFVHDSR
jgi:hypothetical protein